MNIIQIETAIIRKTVKALLTAGHALSVNDGEETVIRRSTDAKAIISAMRSTDEDILIAYKPHDAATGGWVRFIYGNAGWDVINDHTMSLEAVLAPVIEFADSFS